jgi:hypothetical protein
MRKAGILVAALLWVIALSVVIGPFVSWVSGLKNEPRLSELCHQAAACKKYLDVRQECATAGDFRTCMRIKMGNYASWSETCSGDVEGGPAVPLPPQTPNAVECYFRTLFWG